MDVNKPAYLEYSYHGIERTRFFENVKIPILSEYFSAIEFTEKNTIIFFFNATVNPTFNELSSYRKECQMIIFRLYLKMKKEGTYFTSTFYFSQQPIRCEGILEHKMYSELNDEIKVLDGVQVVRLDAQGNPISEQEFLKQQQEIQSEKFRTFMSESLKLKPEHENALQVLTSIEHTVLKFMMMYSYLYELCGGNQEKTSNYIKASIVFSQLPMSPIRKRKTTTGNQKEEDVFTYYRNVVGHSYHEILAFSERDAICEIEILNDNLLRILLEKMEGLI